MSRDGDHYKFAAYACISQYSARMRFTEAAVVLTCAVAALTS
jgi:hypothetical protein